MSDAKKLLEEKAEEIFKFAIENHDKPMSQHISAEFHILWLEWYSIFAELHFKDPNALTSIIDGLSIDKSLSDEIDSNLGVKRWLDTMIISWAKQGSNQDTIRRIEKNEELILN